MYTIQNIEDAIVNAFKASPLNALCKTIDSYHGEIDDLVAKIGQLTVPLPAVYVIYSGSVFNESANRSFDDEMTFTTVFIAKDLRGNEKLKAAIYPMIEAGKTALIDNNLNLDIEPFHPIRIEATLITKAFSIYSMDAKTSFSMD